MPDETSLPITPCEWCSDRIRWDRITIAGKKCFMKRNTEPTEWYANPYDGRIRSEPNTANALRNEKLAIEYVREHTSIPVPNIVFYLDEGDRVYLATEIVEGVDLYDIEDPDDILKVCKQLDAYVKELETHRSSKIRGFGVDVCLPAYIKDLENPYEVQRYVDVGGEPFVLCHGDLHRGNVIVDPETMTIKAVIDWEYAGYYPAIIDPRRYRYDDNDILHLADGSLMPRMLHVKMAQELVKRYRETYAREIEELHPCIELEDGEPVLKMRPPHIEVPDPNKIFIAPQISLNALKMPSEAEETATASASAPDAAQVVA